MPQNDRNSRNRKRRRAYDQARDDRRGGQSTQRRSSAGAGSDLGYSGYAGYSSGGHPITNPNYDPDAPRPSRYTERTVNYGSYPDNSITFPTGGREQPERRTAPPRWAERPAAHLRGQSAEPPPGQQPEPEHPAPPAERPEPQRPADAAGAGAERPA